MSHVKRYFESLKTQELKEGFVPWTPTGALSLNTCGAYAAPTPLPIGFGNKVTGYFFFFTSYAKNLQEL